MDYLQYLNVKEAAEMGFIFPVLNLVINGLPSILRAR